MCYLWMYGQVIPALVYAFKIEAVTQGGCPVESWLGTELAKMQWKYIHADHDRYDEDHRRNELARYHRRQKKKREQQYGNE
jgi:hypothetical protein